MNMIHLSYNVRGNGGVITPKSLFVGFRYDRAFDHVDIDGNDVYTPVGVECTLFDNNEGIDPLAIGTSACHWKDNFSKVTGRKISFERAVSALLVTKSERQAIWNAYLAKVRV